MASYMISYDLNRPGQQYPALYEAIKALGAWWHCLDSTWIVLHNGPASAIRDSLKPHLDSNDRLLVTQLTGEAAWVGFDQKCSDWLKQNL